MKPQRKREIGKCCDENVTEITKIQIYLLADQSVIFPLHQMSQIKVKFFFFKTKQVARYKINLQ